MDHPDSGIDYRKVVHGENRLTVHKPLPIAGAVVGRTRVTRIVDKGAGRGVVVTAERTIDDVASGERYATIEHVTFCRGEGGYSATGQASDAPATPLPPVPDRSPDAIDVVTTAPDMALVYRLLADPNPLHADPSVIFPPEFLSRAVEKAGVAAEPTATCGEAGEGEEIRLRSFDLGGQRAARVAPERAGRQFAIHAAHGLGDVGAIV